MGHKRQSDPHDCHRDAIVEEAENIDGMQPLGDGQHEEEHGRGSGFAVHFYHSCLAGEVEETESILASTEVLTCIGKPVEESVGVEMPGRVDARSRVPLYRPIVALTFEEMRNLLHVRRVVDFRVGHFANDDQGEEGIQYKDGDGKGYEEALGQEERMCKVEQLLELA